MMTNSIGILAYGSLIHEPGCEIAPMIFRRIPCRTPFNVEYARKSNSRHCAQTLVPDNRGTNVAAQILVVDLTLCEAKDCLYRRETRKEGAAYTSPRTITSDTVAIKARRTRKCRRGTHRSRGRVARFRRGARTRLRAAVRCASRGPCPGLKWSDSNGNLAWRS